MKKLIEFGTTNLWLSKTNNFNIINKSPKFTSIESPGMSEMMKEAVLNSMSSVLEQVKFPPKKLKKEDSFTQEAPLSIPVGDNTMNMNMKTFYKLMELSESTAEFYIKIDYELGVELNQIDTKAKSNGRGSGRLIYDIKNAMITYYETDTEMNMSLPAEGITVITKVKVNQIQETKIVSK